MNEVLKKFIQKAQQDEQLKTELEALEKTVEGKDPEEVRGELARAVVAISKKHGFALTEEDFRMPEGKLDDAELTAVAGGGIFGDDIFSDEVFAPKSGCMCFVVGGGDSKLKGAKGGCGCVLGGGGGGSETGKMGERVYACGCVLGGGG